MLSSPTLPKEFPVADPAETVVDLVQRARAGDTTAFVTLYRNHVNQVYGFLARRLSSREAAEEATQEVFTRALAGLGRCRSDERFPGWLFGIAHHVVTEHYKSSRRATSPIEEMPDPVDPGISPEDHAVRSETAEELRRARARCLNDKERALFDLLLADLTDKQIAVALGRRPGAIRTAHWRLLIKLRGCLGMLTRLKGVDHAAV
jgi:RNA polymerase sigma-70 factor (ECF subfamily)